MDACSSSQSTSDKSYKLLYVIDSDEDSTDEDVLTINEEENENGVLRSEEEIKCDDSVHNSNNEDLMVTQGTSSKSVVNSNASIQNCTDIDVDGKHLESRTDDYQFFQQKFGPNTLKFYADCIRATDGRYRCITCNKGFLCSFNLKSHTNCVHTKETTYNCKFCNYDSISWKNFKCHVYRAHTSVKKTYTCQTCNKVYSTLSNLRIHENSAHTNKIMFSCEYCGKFFSYGVTLKRHVNCAHTKETKYVCQYCQKVFFKLCNLKIHVNAIHTKEKNYPCQFCEKVFYWRTVLNGHVKRKHKDCI